MLRPFRDGSFERGYTIRMSKSRTIAVALLAMFIAFPPSNGLAQACVSRAESRQLLEQGQVVPLPEAMQQAGLAADRVVDAQLCRSGGGFVYRIRVLKEGDVRPVEIPAG